MRTSTPTACRATATRPRSSRSSRIARHADVRITFTPHLLPLDQGELVSCYVTLRRRRPSDRRASRRCTPRPTRTSRSSSWRRRRPGVRDVRETNICRISVHRDERTGRVIVFGAIDNLWKGAASQAVQNLNLMFGLPEGEGIGVMRRERGRSSPPLGRRIALGDVTGSSSPAAGCRRASGPPASPAGSSRAARRTSALLVCERAGDDQRRAVHAARARSRRRCS